MKPIKFKALKKNGNGWIQGIPTADLKYMFNNFSLDSPDNYEIVPKTICEYTGIKDIYEKDVCRVKIPKFGFLCKIKEEKVGVVEYNEEICAFVIRFKWSKNKTFIQLNCNLEIKIIGNIHD